MPPKGRGAPSRGTFNCPDCDRPFSRKEYVERHRRLKHLGSRPFACDDCGNSFARSDLLRRHRKTCSSGTDPTATKKAPSAKEKSLSLLGDNEEDELPDDVPVITSTQGIATYGATADLFSYPSVASTSSSGSNLSPSNIPTLSPPGDALSSASSAASANSPQTPLQPGQQVFSTGPELAPSTSFAPPALPDPTLAPSMITTQQDSFTQDEILASEVLEDLLRSPQYSRYSPALPLDGHDSSTSTSAPWHGALVAQAGGIGNETSEVMGSWDGGVFDSRNDPDYQGIEFTPEAQALADYFNKGGVGGISALDLGFSYEPTLFPDHLFEPNVPDHDDSRFFLPSQRFCVGYLYPWHVPPIQTLSRFAKQAATSFLPAVPVVHPGTLVMSEMPTHTAFALTVTGAAYEKDGEQFSNEMLVEKRVFLVRGFNKPGNTEDDKFASLQSMLLYQLLGLFHKDEAQRVLSHTFHGALVMMLRQLALPTKVRQASFVPIQPGLCGIDLELAWKHWIKVETWRRVAFIVYLSDLETATNFETAPLLPFAELGIDLPASDTLWNASSAQDWLNKYLSPSATPPVAFLDAIRALLSPNAPAPFSTDGIILSKLALLSSFPLVILSRTLSFLQMKTEETIKQIDPFRSLLGGIGILDGKDQENHDVLKRIMRGREYLKAIPGGKKRGGGEKWWEGVVPLNSQTSPKPASVDPEDFMPPPIIPATSYDAIRKAADKVTTEWPDFMI
ncbi:hypothetical protein T439DRAFT_328165 [Meredithblackwellia eburnea MCA 4105]